MIIKIPEDMRSYENKFLGNFTLRQLICLIIALVFIAPTFWILYTLTKSVDIAGYASAIIGIPIIACGFIKKDGEYFEKIIAKIWQSRVKSTRKRPFVMNNFYEDIQNLYKEGILADEAIENKKATKRGIKAFFTALVKKKQRTK